jgi:hypothetical protein
MNRRGFLLGLFATVASLPAAAEALGRNTAGLADDETAEFGSQFGFFFGRGFGRGSGRRRFSRRRAFSSRRVRAARRSAPPSSRAAAPAAPSRGQSGGSIDLRAVPLSR